MVHIPTLLGYSAGLLTASALLMVLIRPRGTRALWLAAPYAAGAGGCSLLLVAAIFPGHAGIHLGAFLILLAFAFSWQAARSFFDLPAQWALLLLPSIAWLGASFFLFDPYNLEIFSAGSRLGLVALYTALSAHLLLSRVERALPSKGALGLVFAFSAIVACSAVPFVGWLPRPLGAAPSQTWAVVLANGQILFEALLASAFMVSMSKERASQDFYEASIRDPMTQLYNRRFLEQRKISWQRADRFVGRSRALVYFDIDHFKRINDRFGHAVGDQVIVLTACTALKTLRKKDWVFRLGGEEFLCVLPDCDSQEAYAAAERLRLEFQKMAKTINGQTIDATLSAGVAISTSGHPSFDELLSEADRRLYMAKQLGRNRVFIPGAR